MCMPREVRDDTGLDGGNGSVLPPKDEGGDVFASERAQITQNGQGREGRQESAECVQGKSV